MKTIAFFNNKGGVGKTSLVYHLAWMYEQLGVSVLAVDLDPQANLTALCLPEEQLEAVWTPEDNSRTIMGAIDPVLRGTGDVRLPHIEEVGCAQGLSPSNLRMIVGDLALSLFEDELAAQWPLCLDGKERAFRVMSAFHRAIQLAGRECGASLALLDVGPNLGAINRGALIAADHIVTPLAPDLFSIQGLRNLGPTLRGWSDGWRERLKKGARLGVDLPAGDMSHAGYVVLQHAVRLDRPVRAYESWMARIPAEYHYSVLDEQGATSTPLDQDPWCLALLKHYRSLMPLAHEAHKPVFLLRPGDGAIGAHMAAVTASYSDFEGLARTIAERCDVAGLAKRGGETSREAG